MKKRPSAFPDYLLLLLSLVTMIVLHSAPLPAKHEDPAQSVEDLLTMQLEQDYANFAYGVVADAAKRSVDALRYIDGITLGIMVLQSALLGLFLSVPDKFAPTTLVLAMRFTAVALVCATCELISTFWREEGPNARQFVKDFPDDADDTRAETQEDLVRATTRNGTLRRWVKTPLIALAIAFTVAALAVAIWPVVQ